MISRPFTVYDATRARDMWDFECLSTGRSKCSSRSKGIRYCAETGLLPQVLSSRCYHVGVFLLRIGDHYTGDRLSIGDLLTTTFSPSATRIGITARWGCCHGVPRCCHIDIVLSIGDPLSTSLFLDITPRRACCHWNTQCRLGCGPRTTLVFPHKPFSYRRSHYRNRCK